jgi:hypothetical protein
MGLGYLHPQAKGDSSLLLSRALGGNPAGRHFQSYDCHPGLDPGSIPYGVSHRMRGHGLRIESAMTATFRQRLELGLGSYQKFGVLGL